MNILLVLLSQSLHISLLGLPNPSPAAPPSAQRAVAGLLGPPFLLKYLPGGPRGHNLNILLGASSEKTTINGCSRSYVNNLSKTSIFPGDLIFDCFCRKNTILCKFRFFLFPSCCSSRFISLSYFRLPGLHTTKSEMPCIESIALSSDNNTLSLYTWVLLS